VNDRADSRVHFAHVRPRNYLAHIVLAYSATGHDAYSIASLIHEPRDDINAFQSRGRAARGEDTAHTELD
jgi:hypothetical protein